MVESAAESPEIISGVPQSTEEIVQSKRHCNPRNQSVNYETKNSYPKVAGEELRTSGGTYAAVPTKVHDLSSVYVTSFTETGLNQNLTIIIDKTLSSEIPERIIDGHITRSCIRKYCDQAILHRLYTTKIRNLNVPIRSQQQILRLPFQEKH